MNLEQTRLNTFQSWPANAEVEPQRIAKAGFFYTGRGLEVQCFCCGGKISEWNYGDQVMARHRQLNPECSFVKDPVGSGNIPIVNRSPSLYSQVSDPNQNSLPSTSFQSGGDCLTQMPLSLTVKHPGDSSSASHNVGTSISSDVTRNVVSCSMETAVQSSAETLTLSHIDIASYKSEETRLQSFTSWPKSHIVSPRLLAKNGFFYLQDGDRVQCAFCFGKVHNWEQGDDPEIEHRRHFPSCPFHYNMSTGNQPLTERTEDINISENSSETHPSNEPGIVEEIRPFSIPERDGSEGILNENVQSSLNDLGIITHRGPKSPKYSTIESRLRTFSNWPSGLSQTPQQLAQAGFFYTGTSDQVRCFHCDGGLRQWDEQDDPWIEHARWFSRCTYVMLVKGEEFIQQAIAQHPPLLPADELQRRVNEPVGTEQVEYRIRDVTEEELEGLMTLPPVRVALDVGLDPSKIKQVLRQKMEQTGLPYSSSDMLIEAVLDLSSDTASPEPFRDNAHSTRAEREEIAVQSVDVYRVEHHEGARLLNTSKSLPSIAGCHSEPGLQEQDVNTRSMPLLLHERCVKNTVENEFTLEEENRRLKEARLCKICMDEEVGVVFVPCGHLVTCVNCAANVQDCPMCRQPIKATVRTFLS